MVSTVSVGVVVVILVIGSAFASYYIVTTQFNSKVSSLESVVSSLSANHSTTVSAITRTSTASFAGCNLSIPLRLVSVQELSANFSSLGSMSALSMSWNNCANQQIQFDLGGIFNVTLSTYGNVSTIKAYLGLEINSTHSVTAYGTIAVTQPIFYYANLSPNAIIEKVSGWLIAVDPVTYQEISIQTNFTT